MNIQCVQQFCKCISIKIKFYLKIDNKIQNLFFYLLSMADSQEFFYLKHCKQI
jgi:hypothetical protein